MLNTFFIWVIFPGWYKYTIIFICYTTTDNSGVVQLGNLKIKCFLKVHYMVTFLYNLLHFGYALCHFFTVVKKTFGVWTFYPVHVSFNICVCLCWAYFMQKYMQFVTCKDILHKSANSWCGDKPLHSDFHLKGSFFTATPLLFTKCQKAVAVYC